MHQAMSPGSEAALAYGLVFIASFLWLEARYGLFAHGVILLPAYALVVLFAAAAAYKLEGLRRQAAPRLRAIWIALMPVAIFVFASVMATAVYLLVSHALIGRLASLRYREELFWGVPVVFFREAWPVLCTGLPAATLWLARRSVA